MTEVHIELWGDRRRVICITQTIVFGNFTLHEFKEIFLFGVTNTQVLTEINSHRDERSSEFFKSKWYKEQYNTNQNAMISLVAVYFLI